MAEKTYMKLNRVPFDAQLRGNSPAAVALRAELFGTNGNDGLLIEVTQGAGRVNNDGTEVIYKTSKDARLVTVEGGVDVWARMPRGTARGTRPAGVFAKRFGAEILTHVEVLALLNTPEWESVGKWDL